MQFSSVQFSRSVVSNSLQSHGHWPTRLCCPWDFPCKNTGEGCHFLLQGFFPTQGSNPGLLHSRQTLYHLSHQGRHAVLGCNLKNNRMISVHFKGKPFNITVIQAYAQTSNAEEDVERFYEDLKDFLELTPKKMSFSLQGTGTQK